MDFLLVLERIHEKKEAVLGEEFMETLEKSATEIMTRKMTSQEGREMVTKYCQYIPPLDQSYFEQCTDQFLAFALNFADKSIYHVFKSQYNSNFSSVREDPRSPSDLALYIIRRLLAISNKVFFQLIFFKYFPTNESILNSISPNILCISASNCHTSQIYDFL